jgi:TatD DNase family protein
MKYFDAHCHIQFSGYDEDRAEVLSRMRESEVGALIVGVDRASSESAIVLVQSHENLFASVGLHPNDVLLEEFNFGEFSLMASNPKVRAIGECGLDYYRPEDVGEIIAKQKEVFEQHIELAVKHNLPLMIHSRPSKGTQDAYLDTIDMLTSKKREYGEKLRGDMHFFVGGVDEARSFIELDFSLSYTAVITFSHDYDEVLRFAPLTSLLSETDSPFVSPAPNRGKRNEPTAVQKVIESMAQIRNQDVELVRAQILANSAKKFSFTL